MHLVSKQNTELIEEYLIFEDWCGKVVRLSDSS